MFLYYQELKKKRVQEDKNAIGIYIQLFLGKEKSSRRYKCKWICNHFEFGHATRKEEEFHSLSRQNNNRLVSKLNKINHTPHAQWRAW